MDGAPPGPPGSPMIVTLRRLPEAPPRSELQRRFIARADGGELAYVEAGQGPPVLLIHGALTNLDDMVLGPFDALAAGCRVIAVDRPGHGASSRLRFADASPWRQAQIIRDAVQTLGVERLVVVGHSFGGAVALAYAMSFADEIAGAVALAPIVWPEPRLELVSFGPRTSPGLGDMLGLGSALTTDQVALPLLWRAMFLPQAMPERFERGFSFELAGGRQTTTATGEDAVAIVTALWRSVAAYPTCRAPVRILGGDSDIVINNAYHGQGLSRVLPDATYRNLKGLGHMLHHFAVDEVVSAVRGLQQQDRARGLRA